MSLSCPLHQMRKWQLNDSGERMNKTPIITGILHPPKAKPHVKRETVLYHQPILTSHTVPLPPELCPEHWDMLTCCGWAFVLSSSERLFNMLHLFCASPLSAVYVLEDQASVHIVQKRATHTVNKRRLCLQQEMHTLSLVEWFCP